MSPEGSTNGKKNKAVLMMGVENQTMLCLVMVVKGER